MAQVMGTMTRDNCRAQVKTSYKKNAREVANPRPSRPHPNLREIWAIIADFCEKYKIFPKLFIIFTHFSNERNLSIAKGRSPIRARVRTQAGEIKTGESRHASIRQKSGWLDSRATSWRRPNASCRLAPASFRRRRHSSARPRRDSGLIVH